MHSIEYNYAPSSYSNIWLKNHEREPNILLRNADDYNLPKPRTEFFKKSTLYSLPQIFEGQFSQRGFLKGEQTPTHTQTAKCFARHCAREAPGGKKGLTLSSIHCCST